MSYYITLCCLTCFVLSVGFLTPHSDHPHSFAPCFGAASLLQIDHMKYSQE